MDNMFYCDNDLANIFSMSRSWVRNQRMQRRSGGDHFLKLDPTMIGRNPRYRRDDVEAFIASLRR
jgi:hypothetical protein